MNDESQKEKLRQHFARRVTTQARVVLDTWQKDSRRHADDVSRFPGRFFQSSRTSWCATPKRFEMYSHADPRLARKSLIWSK